MYDQFSRADDGQAGKKLASRLALFHVHAHVHTPSKIGYHAPAEYARLRDTTNLLLVLFLLLFIITLLSGLGLLAADTSGTSTTEWRGESEVDVLLGVEADNEGGNVDDLLADTIADISKPMVRRLF